MNETYQSALTGSRTSRVRSQLNIRLSGSESSQALERLVKIVVILP